MKTLTTACILALLLCPACKKDDDTSQQPQTPQAYGAQGQYPQGQYPQGQYPQQPGAYPQQPGQQPQGYPQQPMGGATTPAAPGTMPGTTPAPAASGGTMATPGPLALPCQNDSACGLAHCNTQYGKCAFPCQSQADCITGAMCNTMTGFCLPGGGTGH